MEQLGFGPVAVDVTVIALYGIVAACVVCVEMKRCPCHCWKVLSAKSAQKKKLLWIKYP